MLVVLLADNSHILALNLESYPQQTPDSTEHHYSGHIPIFVIVPSCRFGSQLLQTWDLVAFSRGPNRAFRWYRPTRRLVEAVTGRKRSERDAGGQCIGSP